MKNRLTRLKWKSLGVIATLLANSVIAITYGETVYNSTNQNRSTDAIYKFRNQDGVLSFSDRRPKHTQNYELIKFDCYACKSGTGIDWYHTPLNTNDYRQLTQLASLNYNLSEPLIRAVIHAESHFNPSAKSSQGALGLMQLIPSTAAELGVKTPLDPTQNISGGTRYLTQQLQRFNGNEKLALAAYNAGPGAVTKYNGIPPYPETQRYVQRVLILKSRYEKALN